jgi:hypothetical protein
MTTVGYGNNHSISISEYILSIFYFLSGAIIFVIFIGLISSI